MVVVLRYGVVNVVEGFWVGRSVERYPFLRGRFSFALYLSILEY